MATIDQDTIYQYQDGWHLLHEVIIERGQLLRELEQLAKAPQNTHIPDGVVEFPLARAQVILFELSVIAERIDALIREVNRYAERCGMPGVPVRKTKPN